MQLRSWDSHYSKEMTLQAFVASLIYHWPYILQICLKAKHSAIEIGCGRGVHSIFLSRFVPNVLGIDNNVKLVEKARKNNSKFLGHARFSIRDAFRLDFASGTFDVCFSQGFLEHFSDEEIRLLVEKHLRIAKVMVASVPSALYAVRDRGDERLMRIEDWQQILKDFDTCMFSYGFRPREINPIISVKNLAEITQIVSSTSGKAHICMVVRKATN